MLYRQIITQTLLGVLVFVLVYPGRNFVAARQSDDTTEAVNSETTSALFGELSEGTASGETGLFNKDDILPIPLYLRSPFNRLTLKKQSGGEDFDILPIDLPDGRQSKELPKTGELTFQFPNSPTKKYTVLWRNIEKIESFPELVLLEYKTNLDALTKTVRSASSQDEVWAKLPGEFERLFDYLEFLNEYKAKLPGFTVAYQRFLQEEGVFKIKSGDYLTGLARFQKLFQENATLPNLDRTATGACDLALHSFFSSENYAKCRWIIKQFKPFLAAQEPFQRWETKLREKAAEYFVRAREAESRNDFSEAYDSVDIASTIEPDWPELRAWKSSLQKQIPRFRVAVAEPVDEASDFFPLPDWKARRAQRLLRRMLCEYERPTLEGGRYRSAIGTTVLSSDGRTLSWDLSNEKYSLQNIRFEKNAMETLFAVLQGKISSATPCPDENRAENPGFSPFGEIPFVVSRLVSDVDYVTENRLAVRLKHPFPRPEALFELPLIEQVLLEQNVEQTDVSRENQMSNDSDFITKGTEPAFRWMPGRCVWNQREPEGQNTIQRTIFQTVHDDPAPMILDENLVRTSEEAVESLLAGTIDLIDRVPPWEIETLRSRRSQGISVGQYSVPTLWFIVPNPDKPLTGNRGFRRALIYGLNRQAMLGKILERGGEGIVSSVPFVRGRSLGDPLGYACDPSVQPRAYQPKLATALLLSSFNQVRNSHADWTDVVAMPELVLAYSPWETAELIATMIRHQWAAIGLNVRLVVYENPAMIGRGDEIDFWLVDRMVKEPLVEARWIFGREGLVAKPSSYMELALEKLLHVEDWPSASKTLHEIHRLSIAETTVLPLWQLVEYYAQREHLSEISDQNGIVDLYQNLPNWRIQGR